MMRRRGRRERPSLWQRIMFFYHAREPYLMRYDPHKLYLNILYCTIIILLSLFVYNIVDALNSINVFFIRFGSLLLLLGVYFSVEYLFFVLRDVRKSYHNMKKGHKVFLALVCIGLLVYVLLHQSVVYAGAVDFFGSVDYSDFNLLAVSETLEGGDVVDPHAPSAKSDMRRFITFLPLPWAFLILWCFIAGLLLLSIVAYLYFGEVPRVIVLLFIFAFIVMFATYKVPYSSLESAGIGSCDDRGRLVFSFDSESFSQPCVQYRSSECRPTCLDRKTVCQCEASLFDVTFRRNKDLLFVP